MYKIINSTQAWQGKQALENRLVSRKKMLTEAEAKSDAFNFRYKMAEWAGDDELADLLEEPRLEAGYTCKALRDEVEAIEEALEALEDYKRAIEWMETTTVIMEQGVSPTPQQITPLQKFQEVTTMKTATLKAITGYDVFKGKTFLAHFSTYEEAWAYASEGRGRWVRYWEKEYRLATIAG